MFLDPIHHDAFRRAVLSASARPDARAAVWGIYHRLQQEIDIRRPICSSSGRCCRFDDFGHRLFVTTLEMGVFLHDVSAMLQRRLGAEKSFEYHTSNRRDFEKAAPGNPRAFALRATPLGVAQSAPADEAKPRGSRTPEIDSDPDADSSSGIDLGINFGPGCPFQIEGLCSVHTIRPFGCRIFFCDASSEQWQHELYAMFHVEHRKLHERLDVPYFYVEWRQALSIMGMEGGAPAASPSQGAGHEDLTFREGASPSRHGDGKPHRRLSLPQLHF